MNGANINVVEVVMGYKGTLLIPAHTISIIQNVLTCLPFKQFTGLGDTIQWFRIKLASNSSY